MRVDNRHDTGPSGRCVAHKHRSNWSYRSACILRPAWRMRFVISCVALHDLPMVLAGSSVPERRLNLPASAISQREESLVRKASAAEEHADLRKRERLLRYKVIRAASRMIANRQFR